MDDLDSNNWNPSLSIGEIDTLLGSCSGSVVKELPSIQ